eukprot:4316121-Pyramimonas_sp.AAC.1
MGLLSAGWAPQRLPPSCASPRSGVGSAGQALACRRSVALGRGRRQLVGSLMKRVYAGDENAFAAPFDVECSPQSNDA